MKEKTPYLAKSLGNKEYKALSSSTIVGYPFKFAFKENEYEGAKTFEIQMQFASNGKSHLLCLGKSELAKSIVNSLRSIDDPIQDEEFELAFYQNKKGYPSVYITRKSDGSHPEWHVGIDEKNAMVIRTTKKDGTQSIDTYDWDLKVKAMVEELNAYWPKSSASMQSQGNGLDDIDDDFEDEPKPKKRTAEPISDELSVDDLPFSLNPETF